MAESHTLEHIVQQLQQRFARQQRLRLALDVMLGGTGVALLLSVLMALLRWTTPLELVYGGLAGGMVVVFVGLAWRVRATPFDVLVRTDCALGLHESLSTAYEYRQQHATHPFLPGLTATAARLAPQVKTRRVFPLQIPRRVWALPVLLAALLGMSRLHVTPWPLDDAPGSEAAQHISREGQRLEQWGRALEDVAKREQLDRSMILARQIQQLGQRLQREGGEPGQTAERMATLSQYLQRLQQELRERALMNDAGTAAAHEVLMAGKSMKQELREILQMLKNDTSPRAMGAMAEHSVLRLSRQFGQQPQLEQLLQNLRAGDLDTARQLLQDALQQQQASEEVEHLDRARRALEYASRSIQRGGQQDAGSTRSRSQTDATGSMPMDMGDEGLSPDAMSGMDDYPGPGAQDGVGSSTATRQHQGPELRESEQAASHVEVASGEGQRRTSYMRYLPTPNGAQVPVEHTAVQYQQAAEAVLTQEHIPRAYREQIKQYFLSLGMMK